MFWIHPLEKKNSYETDTHPVVVHAVDVPGHSEVSNLHQEAISHQAVACGQVTVHKVLWRQIHHTSCNLCSNMQHLRETKFAVALHRMAIHQDGGVWTMSPGEQRNKTGPERFSFYLVQINQCWGFCTFSIKRSRSKAWTYKKLVLGCSERSEYAKKLPYTCCNPLNLWTCCNFELAQREFHLHLSCQTEPVCLGSGTLLICQALCLSCWIALMIAEGFT